MNQGPRLIYNSHTRTFIIPQCRGLCKKPLRDMIGPADPVSNLHPIKYAVRDNESAKEKKLRECREELQSWNELFWTKHNLSFMQKKKEFKETELKKRGGNENFSANDISLFYKDFLDKNWKTHLNYLCEWYKKQVYVTFLHFQVEVEKIFRKSVTSLNIKMFSSKKKAEKDIR